MDNEFVEQLNEHEKMMYERQKKNRDDVEKERKIAPLVSPLNDMINFNPFQYIPYAKLMEQSKYPKVVYIADEVGAGKTIETGIIITELLYNREIELSEHKCIIICPNLLCRKWKYTLRTLFGINATIVHSLKDIIAGINIVSFNTISSNRDELMNLKIQLLIIDEAHNASGERYNKIKEIREKVCKTSGYVVLLSATPIGGDKNDSEKQVKLLSEDLETDNSEEEFFKSVNNNNFLCKNRKKYIRYAFNSSRYLVRTKVENYFVSNQELITYAELSEELFAGKNTLMMFQGLNALMSSPAAAKLYFEKLLKKSEEDLLEHLKSSNENSENEDDESEDEYDDNVAYYEYTIEDAKKIKEKLAGIYESINSILECPENDAKLNQLKLIIKKNKDIFDGQLVPEEKKFFGHLIIFTDKLSTAKYLEKELKKEYSNVFRVTGELFESEKLNRLQQYKDVEGDISILIITNVACEGQDMDFGNTIVNYDLDYNPVRLEQRRGRVDRFKVNKYWIYIHNFAVDGFDYNPKYPNKQYNPYSKVKKIFDKLELIENTTGIFYEVLLSAEEHMMADTVFNTEISGTENIEILVKIVYRTVFGLVSNEKELADISTIEELKKKLENKILMLLSSDNQKYIDSYGYVNDLLKKIGITVHTSNDGMVQITVDKKNQDFMNNVYNGGTLISHIVNRGE